MTKDRGCFRGWDYCLLLLEPRNHKTSWSGSITPASLTPEFPVVTPLITKSWPVTFPHYPLKVDAQGSQNGLVGAICFSSMFTISPLATACSTRSMADSSRTTLGTSRTGTGMWLPRRVVRGRTFFPPKVPRGKDKSSWEPKDS